MDFVRPGLRKEQLLWFEQVQKMDEEMGDTCYVCGVNDNVEEASGDEDEGVVTGALEDLEIKEGEEVAKIKADKDMKEVKEAADPRRPSRKKVEDHERTHLPDRNWCPICVQAKGKDLDHRKSMVEDGGLSEYTFDYCFLGDELGCKVTVMVGRERVTGTCTAPMVPMKGGIGQFTTDKVVEMIDEVGDARQTIIIKTDQEPSIKALMEDVVQEREEGRMILEKPRGKQWKQWNC